ncbi:MAG: hypothetical protein WCT12_16680 [Verrucomicrobiota bacterium]
MFATIREGAGAMRDHLGRLLYHTRLKAIQWINLNRHQAEFATLSKAGRRGNGTGAKGTEEMPGDGSFDNNQRWKLN